MNPALLQSIAATCNIDPTGYEVVHGGDINKSYCLYSSSQKYFLKLNNAACYPSMFETEADGLNALQSNSAIIVPAVIGYGATNNQQWLLLE